MANPLTGEFQAVLQVNEATINRLLATIHQNGGRDTSLPGFVHSTQLRVGDPHPIDGMSGVIALQVGVPRIELIHAVSDRFWLDIAVRARYKPDPGTVPIPEFIRGTVRAQYRIDSIDPQCFGWQHAARDYLWIRSIDDTVSFIGAAEDDLDDVSVVVHAPDPAVANARITRLASVLLKTRFEAVPHKVSRQFRPGSMRSLHIGTNRSVVAMPIALAADPPVGRIDSIHQDLLGGRDFGIAIDRNFILGKVQSRLDALRASFESTFPFQLHASVDLEVIEIDLVDVTVEWRIRLTAASAQWLGGLAGIAGALIPGGLVLVTLKGGARTQDARLNWDFELSQFVVLSFDAPSERFAAFALGSADVKLFGALAAFESEAKKHIQPLVSDSVEAALSRVLAALDPKSWKDELIKQLQTIDDQASAAFDEAQFTSDGLIVRGSVTLSPRRPPIRTFAMTPEQNGYTAFNAWIPGGRIDAFRWSWTWFNNTGERGSDTRTNSFMLRRPRSSSRGRFGVTEARRPLPGLDGMGQVCLAIEGVQVDPVTGEMVEVLAKRTCNRFGFEFKVVAVERIFVREWVPGPRDPIGPVAEAAIHEVGGPNAKGHGANTLVVRVGGERNSEVAKSLRNGLASSRRRDAGLVVLLLFADGTLRQVGSDVRTELEKLAAELEAPLLVNEDVRGSWSRALGMDDARVGSDPLEWRLVSPTGGVTWAQSGRASSEELASALDVYLFPSPVAELAPAPPVLELGSHVASWVLNTGLIDHRAEFESTCPPPLGRRGVTTKIAFLAAGSTASDAALRRLAHAHEQSTTETLRVVVVDSAAASEMDHVYRSLPEGVLAIPDPVGRLSKWFGIRTWPSLVTINEVGRLTEFESGTTTTEPSSYPGERHE